MVVLALIGYIKVEATSTTLVYMVNMASHVKCVTLQLFAQLYHKEGLTIAQNANLVLKPSKSSLSVAVWSQHVLPLHVVEVCYHSYLFCSCDNF